MMPQSTFFGSNPVHFSPFPRKTARWLTLAAVPLLVAGSQLSAQQYASPGYPQYGYGNQMPPQQGYVQQQPQYAQQPTAPQEAYIPQGQPYGDQYGAAQPTQQPLSPDRLEQLVAPIALYPDTLLAQILAASTYPAQVAVASQWVQQMQSQGYASPDQVAAGANSQSWDPSVKALTAFPQVLAMMDQNLQWTTELGNAYFNQPQDVMQTVQVMRQRAEQAGTLQNTPQETVTQDQGAIELAPPTPQTVYVPQYNPWGAYGAPVNPYPGFSLLGAIGSFLSNGLMRFGPGIAMSAFQNSPFGWLQWGLDWLAHAIFFHHSTYMTQSTSVADWGFPYGGRRAYYGYGGGRWSGSEMRRSYDRAYQRAPVQEWSRPAQSYERSVQPFRNDYGRGNYTPNYNRQPQQAYNRVEPAFPRQQNYGDAYGRYGYNSNARQATVYPARPTMNNSYRAQQPVYQQRGFADENRSSDSHFFGHGKESNNFASYKAPKMPKGFGGGSYKAPKMPKAPKAPKMSSHSGGGGHNHFR